MKTPALPDTLANDLERHLAYQKKKSILTQNKFTSR